MTQPGQTMQIFVGGCDRSGTTMLASLIGAHSEILSLPESHFIAESAAREDTVRSAEERLRFIQANRKFQLWRLSLQPAQRETLCQTGTFEAFYDTLTTYQAEAAAAGAYKIWLDHAPLNVSRFVSLAKLFPNARFLHMVRDGRAVANSWLPLDWGPRHILTLADHWAMSIAQGLAAEQVLGPRLMRLSYESLVADPPARMAEIAAFLGVEFQEAMLTPSGFALPDYSRTTHSLLTGQANIDQSRQASWKKGLTARQIELFEYRVGDLLPALGYDIVSASPDRPSRKELLSALWSEVSGRFRNILRQNRRHGIGRFSFKN